MTNAIGRFCSIPVLCAGIVLLTADRGRAEQLRDPENHFTIDVPAGWELIPKDSVIAANAAGPDWLRAYAVTYSGGLQRQSDRRPGSPMILIQFEPVDLREKSIDYVQRKWATDFRNNVKQANEKFLGRGRSVSQELPLVFNGATRRFVMQSRMDDGQLSVVSYGIGAIGRHGLVLMNCYARKDEFAEWQPGFDAIAQTLRFDSGYEFEPTTTNSIGGLMGVIGAAGVIAVAVLAKLARRRTSLPSSEGPAQATESPQ